MRAHQPEQHPLRRLGVVLIGALLCAQTVACTFNPTAGGFCELGADCDDITGLFLDPVIGSSDDSAGVCAVNQETFLAALRANSEDVCHEMAEAWEIYMACAVEEGCDAFELNEPECKDELDDYSDLRDDAGNRCNE